MFSGSPQPEELMAQEQSFASHSRYYPWHHFVVQPILLGNLVVEIMRLQKYQTVYHVWLVVFAIGLIIFSFTSRSMSLRAQDRVIRLEETLRLSRLLPATEQAAIAGLRAGQLVALRFASDEEVPDLVRRIVSGELNKGTEIKKEIRNWRPDYLRV
jgi:hypothetical protein